MALLLTAFVLAGMANVQFWKMQGEIVEKRPELTDWLFGFGTFFKTLDIQRLHRELYPSSSRSRKFTIFFAAAAVTGFSGFEFWVHS